MFHFTSPRRCRAVAIVGAGALAASMLTVLAPTAANAAAAPGTLTVTQPSNGKLAALTAKQVVVLTVSGTNATQLTEDNVASVSLVSAGGTAGCLGMTSYVVTSPTTLTIKTPTNGCAVSATSEDVVVTLTNGDTLTKAGGLTFVPPPKVKGNGTYAAGSKPILTDNSASLATAGQVNRFQSTGGQIARVNANAAFAFDPRTNAGLKVSLGTKDGTEVKVWSVATPGTQLTASNTTDTLVSASGTSGTELGNYLTFKTPAGMDPTSDTLIITQNGVSKTFLAAETGVDVANLPVITGLSPTTGKPSGGNTVTVTATGLDKTLVFGTSIDVWFCGKAGTGGAFNTAGTAITVVAPDVSNDANGLGLGVYGGACPVYIETTVGGVTTKSPVNAASIYGFVTE